MRYIFLLVLSALCPFGLSGQDAKQDMEKVINLLLGSEHLYYQGRILSFEKGQRIPSDSLETVFQRKGRDIYAVIGQVDILIMDGLNMTVDHESRTVMVQKTAVDAPPIMKAGMGMTDLFDLSQASVRYLRSTGPFKLAKIVDPRRPNDEVVVRYDPADWSLKEVSITTTDPFTDPAAEKPEPVTVVIRYTKYSAKAVKFPHKMGQYVVKKGGKYVPAGKCKGYSIAQSQSL